MSKECLSAEAMRQHAQSLLEELYGTSWGMLQGIHLDIVVRVSTPNKRLPNELVNRFHEMVLGHGMDYNFDDDHLEIPIEP